MDWQIINQEFYNALEKRVGERSAELEKKAKNIEEEIESLSELPADCYGFTSQQAVEVEKRKEILAGVYEILGKVRAYSLSSALKLKQELHKKGLPAIAVLPEKVAVELMKKLYVFYGLQPNGYTAGRPLPETALEVIPRILIALLFFLSCFFIFSFFGGKLVVGLFLSLLISLSFFSEPVSVEDYQKKFGKEKFILHDETHGEKELSGPQLLNLFQWIMYSVFLIFNPLLSPTYDAFGFQGRVLESIIGSFVMLLLSFFIRSRMTRKNLLKVGYFLFYPQVIKRRYYFPRKTDEGNYSSYIKILFKSPVSVQFLEILNKIERLGLEPVIAADKRSFIIDDNQEWWRLIKKVVEEEKKNILQYRRKEWDPIVMTRHEVGDVSFLAIHIQEGKFLSELQALSRIKKIALTIDFN